VTNTQCYQQNSQLQTAQTLQQFNAREPIEGIFSFKKATNNISEVHHAASAQQLHSFQT